MASGGGNDAVMFRKATNRTNLARQPLKKLGFGEELNGLLAAAGIETGDHFFSKDWTALRAIVNNDDRLKAELIDTMVDKDILAWL